MPGPIGRRKLAPRRVTRRKPSPSKRKVAGAGGRRMTAKQLKYFGKKRKR